MDILLQLKKYIGIALCVLLIDVLNGCSSSIKELIGSYGKKYPTFTIKKNGRSQNFDFLEKKIWKNALILKSKKVEGIFGGTFLLALSTSAVFRLQKRVSDIF